MTVNFSGVQYNRILKPVVSKLMGHASEIISVDVYGDNKNIIPDEIPELLKYMDEVLPKEENDEYNSVQDTLIDVSEYINFAEH